MRTTLSVFAIGAVDNGGDTPIVFNPGAVRLDSVQTVRGTIADLGPIHPGEAITVAPRSSQSVETSFGLPRGTHPRDVLAFRVRWATSAGGESYSELTPFVDSPDAAYVPVYAYYYPYAPFDTPFYDPYWRPHMHVVMVRPYPRRMIVHGAHHA